MHFYTMGADPEVFLRHKETKAPAAVCGLVGGTKKKRKPMVGMPPGFCFQEDNVMLEFNIPATKSSSGFATSIEISLNWLTEFLASKLPGLEIAPDAVYSFPETELSSPKAKEFGCAPDYNAYETGAVYPVIKPYQLYDGAKNEWRFAGGHLHLGYASSVPPHIAAQFCDVIIGLPQVRHDKQQKRRALYGQAGRYRPTSYGLEYRTLSNFWIFDSDTRQTVAHLLSMAGNYLQNTPISKLQEIYMGIPWKDVQEAINTEDADRADNVRNYIAEVVGI